MKKLQDGSALVTGWDFPTFFYPNDSFIPDNWDSGLLCSPLLLRVCEMISTRSLHCFLIFFKVFKHIFTSPSSAMRDEPGRMKTKGSQTKLNGMDSVSAVSIAYTVLQV
jgi:hypothetical protein